MHRIYRLFKATSRDRVWRGLTAERLQVGEQGHHLDYGNGTLVVPAIGSFREEVRTYWHCKNR